MTDAVVHDRGRSGTVEGPATTLCEAFQRTVRDHPDAVAIRTPGNAVELTWSQLSERVAATAWLLSDLGVRAGDTVASMLTNRPEFHIVDLAALHLGATPFSIYTTCPPDQVAHVLRNAGSRVVVTEEFFLEVVAAAREDAPDVNTVVCIDGHDGVAVLDLEPDPGFDLHAAADTADPGDVAVLIYTSGTTGPPKGVQLTHANLIASFESTLAALPAWGERGRLVSYLPHAHLADRAASHYPAILTGSSITCVADPRDIIAALPDARPTIWGGVPRIWEKLKTALEQTVSPSDAPDMHAAVRAQLGLDEARVLLSGAAPIGHDVLRFFAGIGLEIIEVFGMSESSAIVTLNPPGAARIGTVGKPCPGAEIVLAEDDEVLIRGAMVMIGYRGDPAKTAEALDADGWLHTGDVGQLDADGYLRIVDRKKELIINAAGKNMSPANIENTIKAASPLIGQAVAIGDRRPYNTALLVLDPDAARAWAAQRRRSDASAQELARDDELLAEIAAAVQQANGHLSRVEQIKRWLLLPEEWLPGGPELTPTSKLKRRQIADRYSTQIEILYS